MERYAAFLRGMNLGGRRIKNEELRAEFETLRFADVACFRASGNVLFSAKDGEAKLTDQIEAGLGEALGYEVPVFLRSAKELSALAAHEPFDAAKLRASEGKLQVALLSRKPATKAREQALAEASDEDHLAIEGRELYWLPRGRMSDSELDLKLLEAVLGPWTMRTMGTIEQIVAKHFA
jgi:uncharacterized protein (DUF1697 family)